MEALRLRRYFFSVYHEQSELGGAELCSGLPTPDPGGHEVALRGTRHRRPFLHQHPRRGAVPRLQHGPLQSSAGTPDHKPADEVWSQLSKFYPSLSKISTIEQAVTLRAFLIVCLRLLQEYVRSRVRHAGPSSVGRFLQFSWHWPVSEEGGQHGLCDSLQPHRSGTEIRPATWWVLHTTISLFFYLSVVWGIFIKMDLSQQ